MFRKILVADRGEIALRIIRACKELGVETVAVHSEADINSLHIKFADEDVNIGPAPGRSSYQNIPHIISAAELTDADAIHPGYGPLAESAEFAEICESCGIVFIGPPSEVTEKMGDKAQARSAMAMAGVPVVLGSSGRVHNLEAAWELARQIGFPVLLKAVIGGGGRGMRVVRSEDELEQAWRIAESEAKAIFGLDALYIERYMEKSRHVEIQVLADRFGKVVHLGERECTIQRRYQKLVEESPSPAVYPELREQLGEAAVRCACSVGYEGVGTVEFLLNEEGNFYFIEMNTRIQVEHPITEMVTGVDLVKEQIKIATGAHLGFEQEEVRISGHAVECRINAEDPSRNFTPDPGTIEGLYIPGGHGIRVDTHLYAGYRIPPYYDSLLAKLIAHGRDREEAILRMRRALDEFTIDGVATTIPFHQKVMADHLFQLGQIDTTYIERFREAV